MATKGKTDKELWESLDGLDDDLLDLSFPDELIDQELRGIGIEPDALDRRSAEFIERLREEDRLSWQVRARERQERMRGLAARATSKVPAEWSRKEILDRLDTLRANGGAVGNAVRLAARNRKPEESSDEELRALLEEMEKLRAIDSGESE